MSWCIHDNLGNGQLSTLSRRDAEFLKVGERKVGNIAAFGLDPQNDEEAALKNELTNNLRYKFFPGPCRGTLRHSNGYWVR